MVKLIEDHFEPVAIYNNVRGKNAEILEEFREPSWNYQVIRFITHEKKDLIPRKDRINTIAGVSRRMIVALEAAKRPVPDSLRTLAPKTK
ncbi:MAG: hypothetical protein ACON5H_01195 [Akkermansiaceae bacterium]